MEVWFNPSCSKCRLAKEMLDEAGVDYTIRRYLDEPPAREELARTLDELGLEPWDITRFNEPEATALALKDQPRDDRDAWITILAEHPRLIQRPILRTADGSAWIGRTEDAVTDAVARERGTTAP